MEAEPPMPDLSVSSVEAERRRETRRVRDRKRRQLMSTEQRENYLARWRQSYQMQRERYASTGTHEARGRSRLTPLNYTTFLSNMNPANQCTGSTSGASTSRRQGFQRTDGTNPNIDTNVGCINERDNMSHDAKLFHGETQNFCCNGGKITLPEIMVPLELYNLFTDQSAEGRIFRQNIRAFNHVFSFTSLGAKLDESVAGHQGVYDFRAHSTIYHKIGTLLPVSRTRPRYIQMFIYDTEHETENRLLENNSLDRELVDKIKRILDAHNLFFQTLRQLAQRDDILDCYYDPLQYHLLLPYGTYGWDNDCRTSDDENDKLNIPDDYDCILRAEIPDKDDEPMLGPKSFDDLLIANNVHYPKFKQAAEKRGLLEEDDSIRQCLIEARAIRMPSALRRLFATIMLYCQPTEIVEDYQDLSSMSGLIEDELTIPIPLDDLNAVSKVNLGQLHAFNIIKNVIMRKQSAAFFIDGPGGTGKIFLYRVLLASFRNVGFIMVATATSGGDFRQVVPVVVGGTRSQAMKASIVESYLWSNIKVLHLTDNIRANNNQSFSEFLLNIGNGEESIMENNMIRIPDSMAIPFEGDHSIDRLIEYTFSNIGSHTYDPEYMMD
ncbi:UNVERIFIED_CONTAM: hypothetical protein Sradi_4551900 [Sesamum radiatum]|uniref:ATP-dependent DNA helicase n=1 Tax=Sesamum radiatum TaxID=300843 RepID=A0AAW2NA78_SESRA